MFVQDCENATIADLRRFTDSDTLTDELRIQNDTDTVVGLSTMINFLARYIYYACFLKQIAWFDAEIPNF